MRTDSVMRTDRALCATGKTRSYVQKYNKKKKPKKKKKIQIQKNNTNDVKKALAIFHHLVIA